MALGQWLGLLSIATAFYILWYIRQMLLLVFMAVILATALNGVVQWLQRRLQVGRGIAVLATAVMTLLLITVFVALVFPPFVEQFQELVRLAPKGLEQIRLWYNDLKLNPDLPPWFPPLPEIPSIAEVLSPDKFTTPEITQIFGNFFAFFQNTLAIVLRGLLVLVLTIMLLANPGAYRQAFLLLFPSFYRRRADVVLTLCEKALGNWSVGILLSSCLVACLSGMGLWILKIKLVLAHALLAGLLNFIPNLGPTMSVVFPLSIALLDSPWKVVAILILYLTIQQVESYFITPTFMAQQVELLPALTLIGQIFFASVFGFLGLLLALPLAVVAKVLIQEVLIQDILDGWNLHPAQASALPPIPSARPPEESGD